MTHPRVMVVGSSNTDLVVRTARLPTPGETVLGEDVVRVGGGKGANQAVAAARLGARVTLVARLGRDVFGDAMAAALVDEGIADAHLHRDSRRPSGVALIVVDQAGENLIAVAPGANEGLSPADVEAASAALSAAGVLLLQLEVPLDSVERAAEMAAAVDVPVILDPAPAPDDLSRTLLSRVWLLTPNASEAARLSGVGVKSVEDAARAAQRLHRRGVVRVCITLGAAGCLLSTPEGVEAVPAPRVEAVDATAAGDAFNGALGVFVAAGLPLRQAVARANRAAALSVTRLGAQPALPRLEELDL